MAALVAGEPPLHPFYRCDADGCEKTGHWRRMMSTKQWIDDDAYTITRVCVECVRVKFSLPTDNAAYAKIKEESGRIDQIKRRHKEYVETTSQITELFPAMQVQNKRGVRVMVRKAISRKTMQDLWDPLIEFILLKKQQLGRRGAALEEHSELVERLRVCTDPVEGVKLMEELEQLQLHVQPLAFSNETEEVQDRYLLASSFSDEWTRKVGPAGELLGYKRSWYICKGQSSWGRCAGLMASKAWRRKNEDPLMKGQKYYCNLCNNKFNHSWGQLMEVLDPEDQQHYFYTCDTPPWDVEDVRAMHAERHIAPKSPEILFEAMQQIGPTVGLMVEEENNPGAYWFNKVIPGTWKRIRQVDDLPHFKWNEIFNLV